LFYFLFLFPVVVADDVFVVVAAVVAVVAVAVFLE